MATAQYSFTTAPTALDPYKYQPGFGGQLASETIPGTLVSQTTPQHVKGDLYTEGVTGSCFTAPRADNLNVWHRFLYRIRPSMGYPGSKTLRNDKVESSFLPYNPRVHVKHDMFIMGPLDIPPDDVKVDFIDGLQTAIGAGDIAMGEGIATHLYAANVSMKNRAFYNTDGDFLILPQVGRLDVQTELGKIMVKPGELVVVQKGLKFSIGLPDSGSRGYAQEIYGSHWQLPELGPIGGHGLANALDFRRPVAHFDLDKTSWESVYKQNHTPFDVVAWKGNYVPYKYDLDNFVYVRGASKDHLDPSLFTVLTAKSKAANIPIADFGCVGPHWDATANTFRGPYYHRNNAAEISGLIRYGDLGGIGDQADAGGLRATKQLPPILLFFVETSLPITITDFVAKKAIEVADEGFEAGFNANIDTLNAELKEAGLPELVKA